MLCSSHLLCIAAIPGVSEDDFDDSTKENEEPSEIATDTASEGTCLKYGAF